MKKKPLTSRKKLKMLGFAVIPALLLCYELSIKRTIEEYRLYREGQQRAAQLMSPADGLQLQGRQVKLMALYSRYALDTLATERNLLAIASHYCDSTNLTLKEYRNVSLVQDDSMRVLTRILTVEGKFIPGLKMIYDLETKRQAGRVSSVAFTTVTDHRDKSTRLDCTLYIQNLMP
jgi:hypothetical protein